VISFFCHRCSGMGMRGYGNDETLQFIDIWL
jgi:hypothetical protein